MRAAIFTGVIMIFSACSSSQNALPAADTAKSDDATPDGGSARVAQRGKPCGSVSGLQQCASGLTCAVPKTAVDGVGTCVVTRCAPGSGEFCSGDFTCERDEFGDYDSDCALLTAAGMDCGPGVCLPRDSHQRLAHDGEACDDANPCLAILTCVVPTGGNRGTCAMQRCAPGSGLFCNSGTCERDEFGDYDAECKLYQAAGMDCAPGVCL
jgi:hypothetical protein